MLSHNTVRVVKRRINADTSLLERASHHDHLSAATQTFHRHIPRHTDQDPVFAPARMCLLERHDLSFRKGIQEEILACHSTLPGPQTADIPPRLPDPNPQSP